MKMRFTVAVGITLTLTILIGGCVGQQAKPSTSSGQAEQSGPIEKLEYIAVDVNKTETSEVSRPAVEVPYADTAIIGQVIENLGTVEIDNKS